MVYSAKNIRNRQSKGENRVTIYDSEEKYSIAHEVKKNLYIKSGDVIEAGYKIIDLKNATIKEKCLVEIDNKIKSSNVRVIFTGGLSQRDYNILRIFADKGNENALYNLGIVYEKGLMGNVDIKRAQELYIKAAEKGKILAIKKLWEIYNTNIHIDKEIVEYWISLSIENKDPLTLKIVGDMYRVGKYVDKNINKALECYRKAANLGDVNSLAMVAHKNEWDMYESLEENNENDAIMMQWKKDFI